MPYRATQDGQLMVESSYKTWSTGEENSNHIQHSCIENPINSVKRRKDMILKGELPRPYVPNRLLEKSGEITPERMQRQSQSKNNAHVRM